MESIPNSMMLLLNDAVKAVEQSKKVMAFSHIDADGISALAIVVSALQREKKQFEWRNIHQINSETIIEISQEIQKYEPDLVIFSDFGTGQIELIRNHITTFEFLKRIIVLDHHLPLDDEATVLELASSKKLIEINPCHHELNGSYDISGAGVAFLFAIALSEENTDLAALAIVGATGDLQDYYGKGFSGINKKILELGISAGYLKVTRDLTFFGINTRPLPYLLQYNTDPYLPGITGDDEACFKLLRDLNINLKNAQDEWRVWVDLDTDEKQRIIQKLIQLIIATYNDPQMASGLIGDVVILTQRPEKTEMRNAKEFSTLLNACGRNRQPEVGVKVSLGDSEAIPTGRYLLQQHRQNLAQALRLLENGRYVSMPGCYLVDDPEIPDTIIGVVIGMAQGSRIIPIDKPVIGISSNSSEDSPLVKLSGRAHKNLIKRGINLKETFVSVADTMNESHGTLVAEAGGHPMAAGAFIHKDHVAEFINRSSQHMANVLTG
ncbi:MAG: DHH family phosphoesterase [Candidatus Thorarchaeota archaeon]